MDVHDAIMSRRSVRKFLSTPVPEASLRRILLGASMAPSGHNIQPWKVWVIGGETKRRLSEDILKAIAEDPPDAHLPEYDYYPKTWFEPFLGRRRATGYGLYDALAISREDTSAREAQMSRNYVFFDAPVGIFVSMHRDLATGTYMDIGMFIQNILIGARGEGLHTCGQAAFTWFHDIIRRHIPIPDEEILACGIALGYEDVNAPENSLRVDKLGVDDFTTFIDLD